MNNAYKKIPVIPAVLGKKESTPLLGVFDKRTVGTNGQSERIERWINTVLVLVFLWDLTVIKMY